jgi:IS30 family transposase
MQQRLQTAESVSLGQVGRRRLVVEMACKLDEVWFCDSSAPWQKGAVENVNKRIRRFMPGDTDLAAVSQCTDLEMRRL